MQATAQAGAEIAGHILQRAAPSSPPPLQPSLATLGYTLTDSEWALAVNRLAPMALDASVDLTRQVGFSTAKTWTTSWPTAALLCHSSSSSRG